MGYTHNWSFKNGASKENYLEAIKDIKKILEKSENFISIIKNENAIIEFNGKGEDSCEPFILQPFKSNFCKTHRLPYDKVVIACLGILKHHLRDLIKIGSDGHCYDEFIKGIILAKKSTDIDISPYWKKIIKWKDAEEEEYK